MNTYDKVLVELKKLEVSYDAIAGEGHDKAHAFVDANDDRYSIEIVDHGQTVEVHAFRMVYRHDYEEVTCFNHRYKTVKGAVKRVQELQKTLG